MLAASHCGSRLTTTHRFALAILALFAGTFVWTPGAKAEVTAISGTAFIQQCPCNVSGDSPNVNNGVLVPTEASRLYAAIDFPASSRKICSVSLVYQDINANEAITARLLRKNYAVGSNPFNNPVVVATVNSAPGVVNTVRKTTTALAPAAAINENTGFYYVEVFIPTINLALLGVQIDHRPTCP